MIRGIVVRRDPEHGVPLFRGRAAWSALFALYGIPNPAPTREERASRGVFAHFASLRAVFVETTRTAGPWPSGSGADRGGVIR